MDIFVDNPARSRRGGNIGADTFPDIPGFVDATWQGRRLRIRFDRDLTATEQQTVRDRAQSLNADEETLRRDARAYLTRTTPPTALQTFEQVKRLTRLLLGDYDGTGA